MGKCRLTITPPEFIKGVRKRRLFRRKKIGGRGPTGPPIVIVVVVVVLVIVVVVVVVVLIIVIIVFAVLVVIIAIAVMLRINTLHTITH